MPPDAGGHLVLSGIAGGLGLWVNASIGLPVVAGVALGGWIALGASALKPAEAPAVDGASWQAWALPGRPTGLACYLLEYFPSHLGSWDLKANHPAHALAWLGLSELVALSGPGSGTRGRWRVGLRAGLAVLAVASIPVTLRLAHGSGLLSNGLAGWHLTDAPNSATAATLGQFLEAEGRRVCGDRHPASARPGPAGGRPHPATEGPGFPAGRTRPGARAGPRRGGPDQHPDPLVQRRRCRAPYAPSAADRGGAEIRADLWAAALGLLVLLLPGAILDWPAPVQNLDENDLVGIIERGPGRDAGAPLGGEGADRPRAPQCDECALLLPRGGLRGLATLNWQNTEGLGVAVRIVDALTPEEAQALISERQVSYLILPQWDTFIDAFAQNRQGETQGTFLERLHNWALPAWLRPVPYVMPTIPGFANQSVAILEVVDEQETAVAASRLAEYFLDMGNAQMAENAAQALRRFPADLGALLARTQVAIATGQTEEFNQLSETLVRRARTGADRTLAWDQKVALSVVLAQAHQSHSPRPNSSAAWPRFPSGICAN